MLDSRGGEGDPSELGSREEQAYLGKDVETLFREVRSVLRDQSDGEQQDQRGGSPNRYRV